MTELTDGEIARLQAEFETAYPQAILRWAAEHFGERLAVVTSFQPTGIVTLHMLHEIAPQTTVLTLETGLLFPETRALIDQLESQLNLNIRRVRPQLSVEEQAAQYGDALWARNPDQCCQLRKVAPLGPALEGFDAWVSGLRRDQSSNRAATPIISRDRRYGRIKLAPFATWTEDMLWTYIHAHELPYNELHDRGYPSIGCWPCTAAVDSTGYSRAGRWTLHAKAECGIHLSPAAD